MASNIDETVPTYGNATTLSVRNNFATAKTEITDLQNRISTPPVNINTSSSLTLGSGDLTFFVDSSAAAINLTVPAGVFTNQRLFFKDVGGHAGTNNITLSAAIDGGPSALINTNFGVLRLVWLGSEWGTI